MRVIIVPADEDAHLTAEQQAQLWDDWVKKGPQGPIEDDEEPDFP